MSTFEKYVNEQKSVGIPGYKSDTRSCSKCQYSNHYNGAIICQNEKYKNLKSWFERSSPKGVSLLGFGGIDVIPEGYCNEFKKR
jgi:hypothetical protein